MKFRNIPIEIDAIEFDGTYECACSIISSFKPDDGIFTFERNSLIWHTDEIDFRVEKGAWIIKDRMGKIYPCRPDSFKEVYEPLICSKEMPEDTAAISHDRISELYCGGYGKPKVLCLGGTTGCNG